MVPLGSMEDKVYGNDVNELVKEAAEMFEPGCSILDIGCGRGKESIFLARSGFDVTSVDTLNKFIKDLEELAKKERLKMKPMKVDVKNLNDFSKLGNYDVIISMNLLQLLHKNYLDHLISWMQSHTNPGGYNVISTFVARNEKEKQGIIKDSLKENRPHLIRYLFSQNELNERYASWDPDYHKEFLGPWESHGENRHRHYLGHLIAQKI